MKYQYEILNYWNDYDDLYVNYIVKNLDTNERANVIGYYNTFNIGCDYNNATTKIIEESLYSLISKNNGAEFRLPKVSKLSPLLKYIYDFVCESGSNMCHIDYNDWKELKENEDFSELDILTLKKEIKKYNLNDLIIVNDGEYKICGYGCLQTKFNDDREKRRDDFER